MSLFNEGSIKCLLAWDGKTRGVVELPAIPQIGSHLLLEFEEDADPTSCEVLGVSMSVKPMTVEEYESRQILPTWVTLVKVLLRIEGQPDRKDQSANPLE